MPTRLYYFCLQTDTGSPRTIEVNSQPAWDGLLMGRFMHYVYVVTTVSQLFGWLGTTALIYGKGQVPFVGSFTGGNVKKKHKSTQIFYVHFCYFPEPAILERPKFKFTNWYFIGRQSSVAFCCKKYY